MHTVLHLQTDWLYAEVHEPFEERLCQTGRSGLLARDDRTELAVVTDEHDLLGPEHDRDQALRLRGLCRLIDDDLTKTKVPEARISRTDTGARDDIGSLQELALGRA